MNGSENVQRLREAGKTAFRNDEFSDAVNLYTEAYHALPSDKEHNDVRSIILSNRALSNNRLGKYDDAERDASLGIESDMLNHKAYYHRGVARRFLNKISQAREDFLQSLEIRDSSISRKALSDLEAMSKSTASVNAGIILDIDAELSNPIPPSAAADPFPIIASSWWHQYRRYLAGDNSIPPGPIKNEQLLVDSEWLHVESGDRCGDDAEAVRSSGEEEAMEESFVERETGDQREIVLYPFNNDFTIRNGLQVGVDYVVITSTMWDSLLEQFGGGPCIRRPLHHGRNPYVKLSEAVVELNPVKISIQRVDNFPGSNSKIKILCSQSSLVESILKALCSLWTMAMSETRALRPVEDSCYEVIPSKTVLFDAVSCEGGTLYIECRSHTGFWQLPNVVDVCRGELEVCCACFDKIPPNMSPIVCDECSDVRYCSINCKSSHREWHCETCGKVSKPHFDRMPGTLGLVNIGNSCYVNAAIQCLSNTRELSRVFLSNDYLKELNRENPLGSKGRLAEAYTNLLKEIWFSNAPYGDPREFKRAVSCFATQFAGCQQHDAQEFLAFLLDGLHEDLNRIHSKPYVATTDSCGRPDEVVAVEQWTNYLARNQSVVVDSLLGQFKSELICPNPECTPSVTFDPFVYVSLPLPEPLRVFNLTFFPASGSCPVEFSLTVPTKVYLSRLESTIVPLLKGVDEFSATSSLAFAVVVLSRPLTFLPKVDQLIELTASQSLAVFEVLKDHMLVSCVMQQLPVGPNFRNEDLFFRGRPFAVNVPLSTALSGSQIYDRVRGFLSRCFIKGTCKPSFNVRLNRGNAVNFKVEESPEQVIDFSRFDNPIPMLILEWETKALLSDLDMSEYQRSVKAPLGTSFSPEANPTTIYDCLRAFTRTESLGVNDWKCSKCKKTGNVSKRMSFWRFPDVLILHLKRFDCVRRHALFGETANKISKEVQFPLKDLDLSRFVSWKFATQTAPRYELYAVINHFGASFFGHYTTMAKGIDNIWRHFDDDNVKIVPPEDVCQSCAYVLFYRRQLES